MALVAATPANQTDAHNKKQNSSQISETLD
jgi:hypothetical protein